MTPTPIGLVRQAVDYGLKLGFESPETLTVKPARLCTPEFAETLREYKPHLIALLQLPFVMVFSRSLNETVFFCENEDTKIALVQAGAEKGSIYTRGELQILVEHNRARPFIPDELLRLHQTKRTFKARFAN